MPRMRLRVVCATGVTIDTLAPTRAFTRVLFPALCLPTTATKPDLNAVVLGSSMSGLRFRICNWKDEPNLQDRAAVNFQDLKRHTISLHRLLDNRHVTEFGQHQSGDCGVITVFNLQLELIGKMSQFRVPGHDVRGG